jgi:Sulfotransferase domain
MTDPVRNVVWIASYPKSGNTWVRFLVCNLVFGVQESAAALNSMAPDIHELTAVPELPAAPVFFKTHFPFSPAVPLAQRTAAALYVVRHPADVMLSNFHYSLRSAAAVNADEAMRKEYIDKYLAAHGDPRWIGAGMGTWDDHIRSWLYVKHSFPVLPIRYEDLLADGQQGAQRICSFLGLTRTAEEVRQAVEGASFRRMKEVEEQDIRRQNVGIFYKPYLQQSIGDGLRFMRAGQAGEAARVLTPEQRRGVTDAFGPLMRELGYGTRSDEGSRIT